MWHALETELSNLVEEEEEEEEEEDIV